MACCKKKTKTSPTARLCPVYFKGGLTLIENCSDWQDQVCPQNLREAYWEIWVNQDLVWVFNWKVGLPHDSRHQDNKIK